MTRLLLILSLLAVGLTACLDEIDLTPEQGEEAVLIQAKLTAGSPSRIDVQVALLLTYTSNIARPVKEATIELEDTLGHSFTLPTQSIDGWYRAELTGFPVKVNRSYRLRVTLTESGRQYISDLAALPEPLLPTALAFDTYQKDRLSIANTIEQVPYVRYYVSTPLHRPGETEKVRLHWQFVHTYRLSDEIGQQCYFEFPTLTDKVTLLNGPATSADSLARFFLVETPLSYVYAEGMMFSIFQETLTEEAYEYWEQVHRLNERQGTIFDEPPGAIITNFHPSADSLSAVYGYFYAASPVTLRRFIYPHDVDFPARYCPQPSPPLPGYVSICDDCTIDSNGSLIPPDYWDE
ncbi:MAG: DUF4249 family protein [Lewinella sp.]|nr:DUF4249 family protein [Lewinella sp.]